MRREEIEGDEEALNTKDYGKNRKIMFREDETEEDDELMDTNNNGRYRREIKTFRMQERSIHQDAMKSFIKRKRTRNGHEKLVCIRGTFFGTPCNYGQMVRHLKMAHGEELDQLVRRNS